MIWAGIYREIGISFEKGIGWASWLYGFIETLIIYFYCTKTTINSNYPKKEKTICSNKFCREKIFVYNCEWKFITERLKGNCRRW